MRLWPENEEMMEALWPGNEEMAWDGDYSLGMRLWAGNEAMGWE